jgi:hypothetical protein
MEGRKEGQKKGRKEGRKKERDYKETEKFLGPSTFSLLFLYLHTQYNCVSQHEQVCIQGTVGNTT